MALPGINDGCPFCIENGKVSLIADNELAYLIAVRGSDGAVVPDRYFVIPKQHITTYFELLKVPGWNAAFKEMLAAIPGELKSFNISVNQGFAAGMRLPHVHIWVILRKEDESDPSHGLGLAALIDRANTTK